MEPVTSSEVRSDVKEKLLQERKYLLTQQNYHLEAVAQQAMSEGLNDVDVDADQLLKDIEQPNNNVQQLSKEVESIKHRTLENDNKE